MPTELVRIARPLPKYYCIELSRRHLHHHIMAQLVEEGALSEERANYFRALLANELSVRVLRKFLETAVPGKDEWLSNEWWMRELPKNTKGKLKCAQPFQRDAIEKKPPEHWDMSILALAIQNHPNLLKGKQTESGAVKIMNDKRNVLSHKFPATYEKEEFDELFIDLDGSYKSLLGESEARRFCEDLKKIKERSDVGAEVETDGPVQQDREQIYVKEIETILAKRDKALRNAEERDEEEREEEILQIHTTLLDDMIETVNQMKDKTVELKDVIGMRGHDVLATDLDWIIGILSHGSLTTTVPQGPE